MNMTLRLAIAMSGLAFTLAAASPAGAQAVDEAGSIKIIYADRQVILTLSDLSGLPRHDVRLADEASDKSSVSGVALWDVLQKAVLPPRNASGRQRGVMYLRAAGADGQNAVIALAELEPGFSNRKMYLIDRRDGQPLNSVEGHWRLVIPDEGRHARWIRGLVLIELASVKP